MTMSDIADRATSTVEDAGAQLAQLRRQIDTLMSERVNPALSEAAGRASHAAHKASDVTRKQAEVLSGQVRSQPLAAVLIAAGAGFLIGRMFRS